MPIAELSIPAHLDFAALALEREAVIQTLLLLPTPLVELCRHHSLDPVDVLADEDRSCWLISQSYM